VTDPAPGSDLGQARAAILGRIADAATRGGRDDGDVRVVAVSKTVDADRIAAAASAGWDTFGENRVQERAAKAGALAAVRAEWHLIGPLQSNKARRAIELFDVIETVDSVELATRLDRITGEVRPGDQLRVLLQVNVDEDAAKAGFDTAGIDRALPEILELRNLRIDGLMTVGRLVGSAEAARPTFVALRTLSERLRARDPRVGAQLSMGMSEDFEVAVEEGATLVRLGRAIFGARPALG
jgi:pyridoxal phosphate enzyme (YggS family)